MPGPLTDVGAVLRSSSKVVSHTLALGQSARARFVRNRGAWENNVDLEIAVAEYMTGPTTTGPNGGIGLVPPVEFDKAAPSARGLLAS